MNNSVRNFSTMYPCHFRKASGKPFCAIANQPTPCVVSKKNWNIGGQRKHHNDAGYVAAAVGKKMCLGVEK